MGKNIWRDGMMGLVVGDALGCPVQFLSREEIKNRPCGSVTGMESGGVYAMPKGTWTDDSSMAIATMASILNKGKVDPADIMQQFLKWEFEGEYTPFGKAFDQGNTCVRAIFSFAKQQDIMTCGATGEYANGNGALMRILPICLYYYKLTTNQIAMLESQFDSSSDTESEVQCDRQKVLDTFNDEAIEAIHIISGLTHNHLRSKMCCGIYYFGVKSIIDGIKGYINKNEQGESLKKGVYNQSSVKPGIRDLLQKGVDAGLRYYGRDTNNLEEMAYLGRLFDLNEFSNVPESDIRATGYVIDTIEAAFWCLITTNSYRECLLKAVNLGDDADTVGAIAGGLAGLYYGYDDIPKEWLDVIKRKDWIEDMC